MVAKKTKVAGALDKNDQVEVAKNPTNKGEKNTKHKKIKSPHTLKLMIQKPAVGDNTNCLYAFVEINVFLAFHLAAFLLIEKFEN